MAEPQSTRAPQSSTTPAAESAFFSPRSQRQLGLFAAGVGFFALSTAITRRSIVRRYKATVPKFYQPSNRPSGNINGAMEAFEALNIATVNVFSVGIMVTGGLLWAFDIASLDDMRSKVRTNLGVDPIRTDKDAEDEIEEWFASVLARKEFKALRGDKGIKTKGDEDEKKS
ncbi:hypothetical protein L207DRAFT_584596 [Hyaloscypha variabilis F]|uniref:Altered inheritance of mitochondria protein 11 n=1 Tax=Hyaloscypha variabilis (strain UAMH 11265 / GT02V1 / F) TaxID=1149755 RepID=A0A2J6RL32_HYAVF|nr:hypothetical protein L207DRAFT_584596 [Hyaloscypha variabilis F]